MVFCAVTLSTANTAGEHGVSIFRTKVCVGVRIQSTLCYKGCIKGSHSTNGRRTDGAQLGLTGTVGKGKALFRANVDKKWGDSPFKDLEYTPQEETRTVSKQSRSEPMWTENGERGKDSLSSTSQAKQSVQRKSCRLDSWRKYDRIVLRCVQTSSEAQPASYSMVRASFPRGKELRA